MDKQHKHKLDYQYFWIKNNNLKYLLFLLAILSMVLLQLETGIFVR